jgi:transposase
MVRRSKYPEEFRRNAAKLALDGGRSIRAVARELGVNHVTLRNWVEQLRRERRDGPAAVSGEERAELARLRRRVASWSWRRRSCEKPLTSRGLLRPGDRPR